MKNEKYRSVRLNFIRLAMSVYYVKMVQCNYLFMLDSIFLVVNYSANVTLNFQLNCIRLYGIVGNTLTHLHIYYRTFRNFCARFNLFAFVCLFQHKAR